MREHRLWMSLVRTTVATLLVLSAHRAVGAAGSLQYRPQPKTFAYEVEIMGELPSVIETLKGTISYEVTSADEPLKLTYQGGLHQTTKVKEGASSGRHRFGPPPIPFPRGPFGGFNSFGGIGHATNKLALTSRGEIRSLEGTSQMPFLIGNLSLLVFEPLPETDKNTWTANSGVSVEEHGGPSRRIPMFFQTSPEKRTAGDESTSFSLEGTKGDLSTYRKTYQLQVPDGKDQMTINGKGSWTFNRKLGVPESLDFSYSMVVKNDNITATIPVTIKYRRLDAEELAKLEKERKEKAEESRKKMERMQAERKAPLEGDNRRETLAKLKSNDTSVLNQTLMGFFMREPSSDEEMAGAIRPLLKHSDSFVRDRAAEALAKFSPEFEKQHELYEQYSRPMPVDQTGPLVTARTPLPRGLIVAIRWHSRWFPATVVRTIGTDQVEVQRIRWPHTQTCSRSDIRLAPPELDQPNVERKSAAEEQPDKKSNRGFRVWTDDTGTFALVAKFAGIEGENVRLERKKDGKTVKVPLERLSEADRKLAETLGRASNNPFEP